MNQIFRHLRKFVLVFFDEILVYSKQWEEHLQHLRTVLQILQENQLYPMENKHRFGCSEVDYLGHVITENGTSVDEKKLESIANWPLPKSPKAEGFSGINWLLQEVHQKLWRNSSSSQLYVKERLLPLE